MTAEPSGRIVDVLLDLEKLDESTQEQFLDAIAADARHAQRWAWTGLAGALVSFVVLAAVAVVALQHNAAGPAAWIFGTGAVSIVGLVATATGVGGRSTRRRRPQ